MDNKTKTGTRGETRVKLTIQKNPQGTPWEGAINGKFYRIERGVEVAVPESVKSLIEENLRAEKIGALYITTYAAGSGKRLLG